MKTLPFFLLNLCVSSEEDVTYPYCHDNSLWSACSASCGGGFQTCKNLFGQTIYQDCAIQDCEVNIVPHIPTQCVDGYFGLCSASCGGGTQSCRIATNIYGGYETFTRECNKHSCAGIRKWIPGKDGAELKIIGSENPNYPLSSFDASMETMYVSGPVTETRNQFLNFKSIETQ